MNASPRLAPRPLGRTGLKVAPLGLAARGRGLSAEGVERAFHEHGINTFLVNRRAKGVCEGVRRLIRAGHRDELVLVSLVGAPLGGSVRRSLERHLRLLGTDHLDVWLLAWVTGAWYLRASVWSELDRLRGSGKTRAIGFSSHDRRLAATLARRLPLDVLMIRYNAAHRGAEREVFEALAELGDARPGVIAYTATRWGALLEPLPQEGFQSGMSGAECYRFALGHPMVDTVWCGAETEEELREDLEGVLQGPLDPARLEEVRRFGDAVHGAARGRWMFGR